MDKIAGLTVLCCRCEHAGATVGRRNSRDAFEEDQ
jgi:hypothetical protein